MSGLLLVPSHCLWPPPSTRRCQGRSPGVTPSSCLTDSRGPLRAGVSHAAGHSCGAERGRIHRLKTVPLGFRASCLPPQPLPRPPPFLAGCWGDRRVERHPGWGSSCEEGVWAETDGPSVGCQHILKFFVSAEQGPRRAVGVGAAGEGGVQWAKRASPCLLPLLSAGA